MPQDLSKEILDFKTSDPSNIRPWLDIIARYVGDWRRIQDELVKYSRSQGSTASAENIVSAYVTPTLRNLGFVSGEGKTLALKTDGRQCLDAYKVGGEEGFLRRFGLQLILVDQDDGGVLRFLLKHHNDPPSGVSVDQLKEELVRDGHPEASDGTRVGAWISLLRHPALVRVSNDGKYFASISQTITLTEGEPKISTEQFEGSLLQQYRVAKPLARGLTYVPIFSMREAVCTDLRITSFTFDRMLRASIANPNSIRVIPATPIENKEGGLAIGRKYYYFIAVYPQSS